MCWGQWIFEELEALVGATEVLVDVRGVRGCTHNIGECGAHRVQSGLDVFAHQPYLRSHVAFAMELPIGQAGRSPGQVDMRIVARTHDDHGCISYPVIGGSLVAVLWSNEVAL